MTTAASLALAIASIHCGDNSNVVAMGGDSNFDGGAGSAVGAGGGGAAGSSPGGGGAAGSPAAGGSAGGVAGAGGNPGDPDSGASPDAGGSDGGGMSDSGVSEAGDGGNPYATLSCVALEGEYSLQMRDARGCYPAPYRPVSETCTAVARTTISCDCQGYVNTTATTHIQTMDQLRAVWTSKKCTPASPTMCDCAPLANPPPSCSQVADFITPGICY